MKHIIPLIFIFVTSKSMASSENLLTCKYNATARWTGCSITQKEISLPITFNQKNIQTKFDVTYDFDCVGHDVHTIGVKGSNGFSKLDFGVSNRILPIYSNSSINFVDLEPEATYRKTFLKGCVISIHSITKSPDMQVVTSWLEKAADLVTILERGNSLVNLALSLDTVEKWRKAELDRLRTLSWDYLNEVLDEILRDEYGYKEGILVFTKSKYLFLSLEERNNTVVFDEEGNRKKLSDDWSDILALNQNISSTISVLDIANINLDLAVPTSVEIPKETIHEASSEILKYYKKQLRKDVLKAQEFIREIDKIKDYLKDVETTSINELRTLAK